MVKVEFGQIEYSVPKEVKGDELLEEAILYADIATFLFSIPDVLKEHPRMKRTLKLDMDLLEQLAEIGHIVAG